MNYLYIHPSCVFLLILSSVFTVGNSLQCYKCNLVSEKDNGDPCLDSQQIQDCTAPAVCLSAAYSYQGTTIKQYTTAKSCAMPDKDACQKFLDHVKATSPPGKIEFTRKCYTCNETGCNRDSTKPPPEPSAAPTTAVPSASSIITLPALLFVTTWFSLNRLL